MSQAHPTPSTSSSHFQSVFDAALEKYENKTKNKLLTHPLSAELQSCNSPAAVLSVLHRLAQQFDQRRSSDERLTNWLNPTVTIISALSATLGEGVGMVFSPAKVIFAGIGVLLQAAKDVNGSQDVLSDLFGRIENFFKRLELYTEVAPTTAMMAIVVEIMVEMLSILAIATKEVKQKRAKKYLKKLLGKNDIEDALKRLDTLTQEEAQMATAEILKVAHSTDDKVKAVLDDGKQAKEVIQQTANVTARTASDVDEVKRKQLRQDIRKWLSPPDPSTNHNTARDAQHEGTSTWFFEGGIYNQWKSTPSLLWIHGKPGSGKSILCSAVIQDIMTLREAGSASMAYFYCDFRDEDKQSRRNLLLSILFQLTCQSNRRFDAVSQLYLKHDEGARQPSDGALIQSLKEILSFPDQDPVYIIVDALDEFPRNSGMPSSREQVLDLLKGLVDLCLPSLHICVTSRPEIDITTTLEPLTSLRVSLHDQSGQKEDIIEYVSSVVHSDAMMQRWREGDKKLVIQTLSERADGMFRWVYCQLEALRFSLPPSVRGVLDELPETLDETYERVLRDINKANREHARRLLQCLTVAVRPLRVEELAEVLAVDFEAAQRGGIPSLNPDWRWTDQHQAVLSTCSSLIAVVNDGDSHVVQFSHFSVKEFLTSDRLAGSSMDISRYHILLSPANTILAQACLCVLLRLDEDVTDYNVSNVPLAQYAAQHWVDHAQFEDVSSRIQDVMEYFFDMDKSHWAAWLRVYNVDKYWDQFTPLPRPNGGPLYYAALCGFYDLAEHLVVKNPEYVNTRGGHLVSPLWAALLGNHFEIAELLHRHGADVNVRGARDLSPLHISADDGRIEVVHWLLDRCVDVNAQEVDDDGPLQYAVYRGQLEICQILLEHGADVNARNVLGQVPFHWAAGPPDSHRDQLKIMQLLLDHGADVNARDNDGCTPLHYSSYWRKKKPRHAAGWGTVESSRLLLEHGAIIDAKNNEGKTALQVALQRERQEMAEFLSAWGAE